MKRSTAVGAIALVAALLSHDALAGGHRGPRKRTRTLQMTRPADSPDPDATGTVTIAAGASGTTVLHLRHLDAGTTYEIRASGSGDLLGNVTTNARGRANFNLTTSLQKAAAVDGSDAGGDDVQGVDVVDPATGDDVLTGDVEVPEQPPAFGYDYYCNDAGDAADVSMATDGEGNDSFYLDFYPVEASENASSYVYFDFYRDTAAGDALPLDVTSVADLAGREFQIVTAADGTVVIDGTLPDLETYDCTKPWDGSGDDGGWGDGIDWGDGTDWGDGGDWNWIDWGRDGSADGSGDWSFDGSGDWSSDGADWGSFDGGITDRNSFQTKRARRHRGHRKDETTDGYVLLIADAEGTLQVAGNLHRESFDYGDCPGFGFDEGYGFVVGIVIVIDDSFDWSGDFGNDWSGDFGEGGGWFDFGGALSGSHDGNAADDAARRKSSWRHRRHHRR